MAPSVKSVLFHLSVIPFFWLYVLLYFGLRTSKAVRYVWFSWVMSKVLCPIFKNALDREKKELFSELASLPSADPALRKENAVRLLEIGIGSGANLSFYPENIRIVATDLNQCFQKFFEENVAKYPKLHVERYIVCSAENLAEIADNSVDVVVSTHVLCSVDNLDKALKEVRRVLVPGGQFFFVEHVADRAGTLRRAVQEWLRPYWLVIFAGCIVDRDTESAIRKAGFSSIVAREVRAENMPYPCVVNLVGRAIK